MLQAVVVLTTKPVAGPTQQTMLATPPWAATTMDAACTLPLQAVCAVLQWRTRGWMLQAPTLP